MQIVQVYFKIVFLICKTTNNLDVFRIYEKYEHILYTSQTRL